MEKFARIVVGYHGCARQYADELLLGRQPILNWKRSQNAYDWLGEGVYFWEYSSARAAEWAAEKYGANSAVTGAIIQLGACYDLLDASFASELRQTFVELEADFLTKGKHIPVNRGIDKKLRELDCNVINSHLDRMARSRFRFDTVRGAFLEGPPVFAGTTISSQTHIQIAVRNIDFILGVFRPNL